jgi:HEAT repeat protein
MVPGSTFIPGVTADFKPLGVGVDTFVSSYVVCPKCSFAAHPEDFEKPEGLNKAKVRRALAGLRTSPMFRLYDAATLVERNWRNRPQVLAHLALAAKWRADYTGEPEAIGDRLTRAIAAHEGALKSPGVDAEQKAMCTYLIGELCRQMGRREDALAWFDKAAKARPQKPWPLLEQQRFLTRYADSPPAEVLAAAHKGTDWEKVAAIGLLRDSREPAVLAFVRESILNPPDSVELHEEAMDAIGGGWRNEPLKHHLPTYLAALRSKHRRIVQGAAIAVERLRAPEAAPIILEVLEKPVPATGFRLAAALAETATERDLPGLTRLAGLPDRRVRGVSIESEILGALLNTGSKKAVPLILELLKDTYVPASYEGRYRRPFEKAARFPALLEALPDLSGAAPDSKPAVFKVHVLGLMDSPEASRELGKALSRGGDVAMAAATALARRGDGRGKDILVRRIRSIPDANLLAAFLVPADFDAIHARMEKRKAEREQRIRDLRAQAAEEGPPLKSIVERELKQLLRNPDWYATLWLPALGATRNPKARPLGLKFLRSEDVCVRESAVRCLSYLVDHEVGEALARRLPTEEPQVQNEIIRALGRSKDARHVDALLAVAAEPSFVDTKLVWIEAMLSLAPGRMEEVLRRWAKSPDAELAAAAREALAKIKSSRK